MNYLLKKCEKQFYPKRKKKCKNVIEKILKLPGLKLDVRFREFDVNFPNGVSFKNVNFLEYLNYVTDSNKDRYVWTVEPNETGLFVSHKSEQFDSLTNLIENENVYV